MSFFDDLGGGFEEQKQVSSAPKVLSPGIHDAVLSTIKVYEKDGSRRLNIEFQIKSGGRHWETIWANDLSGTEQSMKDYAIAKATEKCTIERDGKKFGKWGKEEYPMSEIVKKYVVMRIERDVTKTIQILLADRVPQMLNALTKGIQAGKYKQPTTTYDLAYAFLKLSGVTFEQVEGEKHIAVANINEDVAIKLTANKSGEKLGLSYGQNRVVARSADQLQIVTDNGDYNDNMDYIVPSTEENITPESTDDVVPTSDAEELDW